MRYRPPGHAQRGVFATGPYQVPHVRIDSYCVYTNNPIGGAFRGFGTPQITWAIESHLDAMAEALGMDPLELRLKNAAEEGSISATGQVLHSVGLKETLRQAADKIGGGKGRDHSAAKVLPACTNPR